jgi:preprotein translocase subunit Sec63
MAPPNLKSSDYYEILGCRKGDDDAALKKAYRKLAVKVRDVTRRDCREVKHDSC